MQSMIKNLEKELDAPANKPAGGVSVFLRPNTGPQRAAALGRKPQVRWRTPGDGSATAFRARSNFEGPGVKVWGYHEVSAFTLKGHCR